MYLLIVNCTSNECMNDMNTLAFQAIQRLRKYLFLKFKKNAYIFFIFFLTFIPPMVYNQPTSQLSLSTPLS